MTLKSKHVPIQTINLFHKNVFVTTEGLNLRLFRRALLFILNFNLGPKCLHGGVCMDDVNGFFCSCSDGYSGEYCECIDVSLIRMYGIFPSSALLIPDSSLP